ncbi:c-type cytochrome domain-containing protein [Mucilaginibacter flavidus]|uniref:c-type cytochrome domain-containing protein n=1 Tax=Mucilaginibacter flavidus TaxID=2949309 RepID=UPI0020939F95|nr:c-type cytochrome domain-containing protein [Mucilaginibacter flavidus]MCO5946419.1 hypothetical protein [Mucilaginibacter flavidus]
MIFLNISTFSGHLHPLIVHLPIGFILLAAVFNILSYSKKHENLKSAVPVALLMGFISAVLACVFGYILSTSGDYDQNVLRHHEFSGITLAIISGILYFMATDHSGKMAFIPGKLFSIILVGLVALMSYSGHQGASLTHGNDYLTMQTLTRTVRDKPTSVDSAIIFEDVVQPILQNKCSQCHRDGKLKGNLSVESLQTLRKGGKSGPAVAPGKLNASELYKRITLDPDNKDFMPKDGKTPLTKSEVKIIKWWIENGDAISGKRIAELKNINIIIPELATYLGIGGVVLPAADERVSAQVTNPDIPMVTDTSLIGQLRKKGLMVRVMLRKPLMLDITLPVGSVIKAAEFKNDVIPLAKNIVWLNISGNNFTDGDLSFLKLFTNLEKLRLEKNPLTDQVSNNLIALKHLEAVNLNETKITDAAVINLKKNPAIKRIYTWGTGVRQVN